MVSTHTKREYLILSIALGTAIIVAAALLITAPIAMAYPTGWTVQQTFESENVEQVSISVLGERVFIAARKSDESIIFSRSEDKGATWEPFTTLDDGSYDTDAPVVQAQSGTNQTVIVIWGSKRTDHSYYQTQIARSTDWGDNFSNPSWTSSGNSNKTQHEADKFSNNVIAWTFCDDVAGVNEVYYGKVQLNGSVGVFPGARSPVDGHASEYPDIACNSSINAIILWHTVGGGAYSRTHLEYTKTDDSGSTWPEGGVLPYDNNYRTLYPCVVWDNSPIVICTEYDINTTNLLVGKFTLGPGTWAPVNVPDSVVVNNGSIYPYAETIGRWEEDVFFRNDAELVSKGYSGCTNLFGADTVDGGVKKISLASTDVASDTATDYAAAVMANGTVYLRRKDNVDPTIVLTDPAFSGSEPIYVNSNFELKCTGATDDFNVTATDVATGIVYRNGIRSIIYMYTVNGTDWHNLTCVEGNNVATTPPYTRTVVSNDLDQSMIKVRARGSDSAGNMTSSISAGWIYVDKQKPHTNINIAGTEGDNGWYTSDMTVTLTCNDFTLDKTWYRVESTGTGELRGNWTEYETPFVLGEGIWKVYYYSTDKAGNTEATQSATLMSDQTAPVCSVLRPSKDYIMTGYYSDETFRLSGTGTDANGLQWSGIYMDGELLYQTTDAFNMSYMWPLQGEEEKTHTMEVEAKDVAGNQGRANKNIWVGNCVENWYFPEGNTLEEFDQYICLVNPGDEEALVELTFMLEDGSTVTTERAMIPQQRDTVKVKDYVDEGHHVSTLVHCSEQAIIAECPSYFIYKEGVPGYDWKGGHNLMGINELQTTWYFAEGTTRKNQDDGEFEEWICLQNPSETDVANIIITYMLGTGENIVKTYQVGPTTRYTVEVEMDVGTNQDVSAKVESDIPIAAVRPQYFNYHFFAREGSAVVGASSPETSWYFAEGTTRAGFQEWLTIQNPNDVEANVKITYMTGSGNVTYADEVVNGTTRATVDVLADVGANEDVSTLVESDIPIIVERPMYFIYGMDAGLCWDGGESALGNPGPSTTYYLAEGTTISNFDTYYSLLNYSDDYTKAIVEYMFGDGTTEIKEYDINPHSRLTINVNEAVEREADVSASIFAGIPITIERPMYFNYDGTITGGHDVNGFGVD